MVPLYHVLGTFGENLWVQGDLFMVPTTDHICVFNRVKLSGVILIVIDGNGKFGCSFNDIKVAPKKFNVL